MEKAVAPTPVLLPGKSHGRRSLAGCSPWGRWGSDTTERLPFHFSLSYIGEGNGNPLQCSCLENPRDGEAWWAAVYGVAQSRTRLKWLSSSSRSLVMSDRASHVVPVIKEPTCQPRKHKRGRFNPWVGKIPTHSSILAWRTPRTEEPGGLYTPWGRKESHVTEVNRHRHKQSEIGQ